MYVNYIFLNFLYKTRKSAFAHEQVTIFSVHFVCRLRLYTICIFPLFNLSFVFFMDREELNKETWGIVLSNSVSQETKIIHIFVIFIKTNFHPWFHYSRRVYMFLIYGFVIKAFIFYVKNFENVYTFEPSAALWWFLHTYMLTFICLTLQIISSELSRKNSWTVVAHCSR